MLWRCSVVLWVLVVWCDMLQVTFRGSRLSRCARLTTSRWRLPSAQGNWPQSTSLWTCQTSCLMWSCLRGERVMDKVREVQTRTLQHFAVC